jgi:hypothetical protein
MKERLKNGLEEKVSYTFFYVLPAVTGLSTKSQKKWSSGGAMPLGPPG